MSKYLSADEFLTGITGETVDFEVTGLGVVQVRSLEYIEIQAIDKEAASDPLQSALLMVLRGLAVPKLSAEHLVQLQRARPGVVQQLSTRISQLSGMIADPEKKDSPPGSGS